LQKMLDELHPTYRFLDGGDIEKSLEEGVKQGDVDLLIVVPRKHNVIDRIFHKSQSKQIAMHTHVPIMSLHE
jgi:nucleotide-binding universal stress UspA family protein